MALLMAESFDGLAVADLGVVYGLLTNSGNLSMSSTGSRWGLNGLRFANQNAGFTQGLASSGATVGCGFWLAGNSAYVNNTPLVAFLQGGTVQIQINILGTGQLQVLRNLTTLATSTGQVPLAGGYVELKGVINSSTGTIEVRLNGNTILTLGSANTQGGTAATWDGVRFGTGANVAIDITMDDLVIWDASGGNNNDFLGDVRVALSIPQSGNGTNTGLTLSAGTDHGAVVDDTTQDGDSTYAFSASAGVKDTYNMTDHSITGSVKAVQVDLIARKDLTGLKQVCPVWRIGSTDYDGTTINPGLTYSSLRQIYELSPATSAAWTISEINGAQLGMKVVA